MNQRELTGAIERVFARWGSHESLGADQLAELVAEDLAGPVFPSQGWRDCLAGGMECFDMRGDVWIASMVWALRHEQSDDMLGAQIRQGVEHMLGCILDLDRRVTHLATLAKDAQSGP